MKQTMRYLPWIIICAGLAGVVCGLPLDALINGRNYAWYWWLLAAVMVVGLLLVAISLAVKVKRAWYQTQTVVGVTHQKHDLILQKDCTYTVADGKKAPLQPGQYVLLAVDATHRAFNLRVNDFVKEYRHHTEIVLANGDQITAVSGNVILRRA